MPPPEKLKCKLLTPDAEGSETDRGNTICPFHHSSNGGGATTTFHKGISNVTPEVGDILKILWKRGPGAISPLFRNILLPDFGVFLRVLMFDQPLHKRCLVNFYVGRPICPSKISIQQPFCSSRALQRKLWCIWGRKFESQEKCA